MRALVADHLELAEIEQVIAPVSILAPDFDEVVGRIPDVQESAAEQVQALRYHLEERRRTEDRPVLRTLSEELEAVLAEFAGRHPADLTDPCRTVLEDGQVVVVGGRDFRVAVSARRRRLGLTVERDGSLVLRAPQGCDVERAETFLREGQAWLADMLRRRAEHPPAHPVRSFRDGEAFTCLGRAYRLLIDGEGRAPVRLCAGRMVIGEGLVRDPVQARRALIAWYRRAGQHWAQGRLQPWAARMEVPEPDVVVRDAGNR